MKNYQLPHACTVGKTRYTIRLYAAKNSPRSYGQIVYAAAHINIANAVNGTPRSPGAVRGTFWHELTHAVLHEMGSALAQDEQFVSMFASRLHKAIETAEFDK